ncbi:MAG TPA: hypothetical protein VHO01_06145, partial [Jatrophihabitans sp.]|nr:hypothetical protein [Jatrophihabitans sp.]
MNVLFRSVLLGLATGGRSSLGVAAVLLSSANRAPRLGSQPVKLAAAAAVAGELTVDKLPMTPSRLEPPGQLARALSGLVGGGWLAARSS